MCARARACLVSTMTSSGELSVSRDASIAMGCCLRLKSTHTIGSLTSAHAYHRVCPHAYQHGASFPRRARALCFFVNKRAGCGILPPFFDGGTKRVIRDERLIVQVCASQRRCAVVLKPRLNCFALVRLPISAGDRIYHDSMKDRAEEA